MRRCALLTIILLVLTACDFSHVKPQQTVVITGRALDASGAALSHVQVHLYKEADLGEVVLGSVFALGSLGAVCLFPAAPAICHKGHVTTTGSDGSYRFTVKGSDTQGLIGDADTLDVVFAAGDGGPSTTLRFTAQHATVPLPAARLWDAGLRVAAEPGPAYAASWRGLPGADGYTVQFLDPGRGLPLWEQPASGSRAHIDARVLEDHPAVTAVSAHARLNSGVDGVYLSAQRSVRPTAGAPPSRRGPCFAVTGTTTLVAFRQSACAATDGDLAAAAHLVAPNGKVVTGVVIELPTARPIALVVARGLGGSVVVEVSTNGRTYRQVGTADGSTVAVRPPGRPVARYVRVRSPSGLDESLLSEVSVW
jgi:hypothetical protein